MRTLLCLLSCAWFAGLAQTLPADKPVYVDPVVTRKVEAEYTPEARAAKLQGTVYLYVEVSPGGKPENVQVMHGLGLGLDEKAVEAVKQWQFEPGTKDGQPEWVAQSVEVQFRLEGAGPWRVRQAAYTVAGDRGEVCVKPLLTRYASPDPAACPANGGAATIDLSVAKDGRQRIVKPRHAPDPTSAAAAKAIESWQFQPGRINGKPAGAKASIEFECAPAAAPVPDPSVHLVGNGVSVPAAVYRSEPHYSKEALEANYQGEVALSLVIDTTGHPTRLRVIKPLGLGMDKEAMDAVSQWRFTPAMKDGKPVSVQIRVDLNFRLK